MSSPPSASEPSVPAAASEQSGRAAATAQSARVSLVRARMAAPPPAPPGPPTWIYALRKLQMRMLYIGFPVIALLVSLTFYLRQVEARTFHVAPGLEASAVRTVLRREGLKEVALPADATIVWAAADTSSSSAMRMRRISSLPGLVSGRADASCMALGMAAARVARASGAFSPKGTSTAAASATASVAAAPDASGEDASGGESTNSTQVLANAPLPKSVACYVLPRHAAAAREAIVTREGGRLLWELEPADMLAYQLRDGTASGTTSITPPPTVLNNPESLPEGGTWSLRLLEGKPLLLGGRRVSLQLFVLVSGVEPFRAYVHHDGVVWRAARKFDPEQPGKDVSDTAHLLGPRRVATGRQRAPLRADELLPLSWFWRALAERGDSADQLQASPAEIWRTLERASVLAATASLRLGGATESRASAKAGSTSRGRRGGGLPFGSAASLMDPFSLLLGSGGASGAREHGAMHGFSSGFALLSVHLRLDEALVPTVVNIEPAIELPDKIEGQPAWHTDAMRRVASDTLNLTGATLHPRRKTLFTDMRSQLQRAVSARRRTKRGGGGPPTRRPGNKGSGGRGGGGSRKRHAERDKERDMATPPKMRPLGQPPPAPAGFYSRWFGSRDDSPPAPPPCKLALPVARQEGEPELCLSPSDVDALAQADTEFLWRAGFRRIIPGQDEDVRDAVRPPLRLDTLLARYYSRWPKEEPPYQEPPWAADEVRQVQEAEAHVT